MTPRLPACDAVTRGTRKRGSTPHTSPRNIRRARRIGGMITWLMKMKWSHQCGPSIWWGAQTALNDQLCSELWRRERANRSWINKFEVEQRLDLARSFEATIPLPALLY
eukprot:Hpha_TRINITY_DN4643_c0_g1::TRINITY_DN4643_c0_g1_i1::g.97079::m.97079